MITVLATDGRWTLNGEGSSILRDLEAASGMPLTLWRVPDGAGMYTVAHAASGGTAVVMAATPPVTPPVDWTGPVCWHVREGCERVFNVEGVDRTATVGDFVDAIARPPAGAAEDAFILVFMAVILLGGARKKFGGSRK